MYHSECNVQLSSALLSDRHFPTEQRWTLRRWRWRAAVTWGILGWRSHQRAAWEWSLQKPCLPIAATRRLLLPRPRIRLSRRTELWKTCGKTNNPHIYISACKSYQGYFLGLCFRFLSQRTSSSTDVQRIHLPDSSSVAQSTSVSSVSQWRSRSWCQSLSRSWSTPALYLKEEWWFFWFHCFHILRSRLSYRQDHRIHHWTWHYEW